MVANWEPQVAERQYIKNKNCRADALDSKETIALIYKF